MGLRRVASRKAPIGGGSHPLRSRWRHGAPQGERDAGGHVRASAAKKLGACPMQDHAFATLGTLFERLRTTSPTEAAPCDCTDHGETDCEANADLTNVGPQQMPSHPCFDDWIIRRGRNAARVQHP